MIEYQGPSTYLHLFSYGGVPQGGLSCLMYEWGRIKQQAGYALGQNKIPAWDVYVEWQNDHAAIDYARSLIASKFLNETSREVLFMLDHDHTWNVQTDEYEGDILHVCRLAAEKKSIVGSVIAKKGKGLGMACSGFAVPEITIGKPGVATIEYIGPAFTAIHRSVLQAISKTLPKSSDGIIPFFQPHMADVKGVGHMYLCEDLAFIDRAKQAGFQPWVATQPIVGHLGEYNYLVVRDSSNA